MNNGGNLAAMFHYQLWSVIIGCIGGGGCKLVITYQETGLLHLPGTVQEGAPQMRRWSKVNLTPSLLAGAREVEQPNEGCLRPPPS